MAGGCDTRCAVGSPCPDLQVIMAKLTHLNDVFDKHAAHEERAIERIASQQSEHFETFCRRLHEVGTEFNRAVSQKVLNMHELKEDIDSEFSRAEKHIHGRIDAMQSKMSSEYVTKKDLGIAATIATMAISVMVFLSTNYASSSSQRELDARMARIEHALINLSPQPGATP